MNPESRPESITVCEPDFQYSLFDDSKSEPIVNVASVPQRSPFRYPGGKTWLVPRLRRWLASLSEKPGNFIEAFAGGGSISLTVAFENLAEQVTMVELDADVAAVWQTILHGEGNWLAQKVATFPFNFEYVTAELARPPGSLRDHAFQTLLRNRINHGGILAPGSGRIKQGENGKGLSSRWYPQTLRSRIESIAQVAHKIRFVPGDGLQVLRDYADCPNTVAFIDPPYTAAGKKAGARLYTHSELDHEELFRITETFTGDFLMTYDNAAGVCDLAERHGFAARAIPMKNTHHAQMTELLIGRNLDWA